MREVIRLHAPRAQTIIDLLARGEVVLATGLYDGTPIAEYTRFDDLIDVLRDQTFAPEATDSLHFAAAVAGQPLPEQPEISLGTWLQLIKEGKPVTRSYGGAYLTSSLWADNPPTIAELLTPLDRRVAERGHQVSSFFSTPGDDSEVHFDMWTVPTFHYHVAGRKEWFIVPPQKVALLTPVGFGTLACPHRLSLEERGRLATAVDGYCFVAEAGETLFFPPQWYHSVSYPERAFGIAMKFGRSVHSMFLARELHGTFFRACVVTRMFPAQAITERFFDEFVAIHDVCKPDYPSVRARFDAIEEVLGALAERMNPGLRIAELPTSFSVASHITSTILNAAEFDEKDVPAYRTDWASLLPDVPLFDWWR